MKMIKLAMILGMFLLLSTSAFAQSEVTIERLKKKQKSIIVQNLLLTVAKQYARPYVRRSRRVHSAIKQGVDAGVQLQEEKLKADIAAYNEEIRQAQIAEAQAQQSETQAEAANEEEIEQTPRKRTAPTTNTTVRKASTAKSFNGFTKTVTVQQGNTVIYNRSDPVDRRKP